MFNNLKKSRITGSHLVCLLKEKQFIAALLKVLIRTPLCSFWLIDCSGTSPKQNACEVPCKCRIVQCWDLRAKRENVPVSHLRLSEFRGKCLLIIDLFPALACVLGAHVDVVSVSWSPEADYTQIYKSVCAIPGDSTTVGERINSLLNCCWKWTLVCFVHDHCLA